MGFSKLITGSFTFSVLLFSSAAFGAAEKDTNFAVGSLCVTSPEGAPIPFGRWNNDCNAFDGNPSTPTGSAKSWAKLALITNLGKPQTIHAVVVRYTESGAPNPNVGYFIAGSDDGVNWTTIRTIATTEQVDSQTNVNATFQYFKVQFKEFGYDPYWAHSVNEVELWGKTAGTSTNITNKRQQRVRANVTGSLGGVDVADLTGRAIHKNRIHSNAAGVFVTRPVEASTGNLAR